MVVAATGRDDHDGVALLYRRRQHHRAGLAALAPRRRQLEHRHAAGPPSEPPTAYHEQAPVEGVHGLQLQVGRHTANDTTTRNTPPARPVADPTLGTVFQSTSWSSEADLAYQIVGSQHH